MTTLVFAAHPDDEILGCGGTIAKLSKKEDVYCIVFSYGSRWPPWQNPKEVERIRRAELQKADAILGIRKTFVLGLEDTGFFAMKKQAKQEVLHYIKKFKPDKILTHSVNDTHPDHSVVSLVVKEAVKESGMEIRLFLFDITSIMNLFARKKIKVIQDISETFEKKMQALKVFESQWLLLAWLSPFLNFKASVYGSGYGFKYSEYFYYE